MNSTDALKLKLNMSMAIEMQKQILAGLEDLRVQVADMKEYVKAAASFIIAADKIVDALVETEAAVEVNGWRDWIVEEQQASERS